MPTVRQFMAGKVAGSPVSSSSFAASVKGFADRAKADLDAVVKKVLFDISARLVERSPVGDRERWAVNVDRRARGLDPIPKGYVGGRFRANWQFGDGQMPQGTLDEVQPSAAAAAAELATDIAAGDVKFGGTYWLVNNLPYSIPLEYGWSKQAPSGMVRVTMAEAQAIVDAAAKGVK